MTGDHLVERHVSSPFASLLVGVYNAHGHPRKITPAVYVDHPVMALLEVASYLVIGTAVGIGMVIYVRKMPEPERRAMLAQALVVATFVYVAFAMAAMEDAWLMVEIGGVLLFVGIAYLGYRHSLWWLAAGWFAHVLWDVALHVAVDVDFVPLWYPVACIGFDVIVGVSIGRTLVVARSPKGAAA